MTDEDLRDLYYWLRGPSLRDVPTALRRDVETRALERFFLDWTLNPSNDGPSPGYLHDLPAIYATAQPGSILWHVTRAVSFAGLTGYDRGPWKAKARESYGAALSRMRVIAEDETQLSQDRVLAALLLIDIFESVYLSRQEPLGAHRDALKHILTLRGKEQFLHRDRFELWRAAQERLQASRITHQDSPDDVQLTWIAKLNASLPDLHVCVDVERMVVLCSAAKKIVKDLSTSSDASAIGQGTELLQTMQEVIESMESWSAKLDAAWRPQRIETSNDRTNTEETMVLSHFGRTQVLHYSDPWLAYKLNFHNASRIVLQESMVEVMEHLFNSGAQYAYQDEIAAAKAGTEKLASTVIGSSLPLLDFFPNGQPNPRGKMARRFFIICALGVVQNARLASSEQRRAAANVLNWIDEAHRLG